MNPSYIAKNPEELFDKAAPEIQQLIENGEIDEATKILGKKYSLPLGSYIALSNVITLILIGALQPSDVVIALEEILKLPRDQAYKLAEDLEISILQKARISVLGTIGGPIVTLGFPDGKSPDELRKEILDTTKRESGFVKDQSNKQVTALKKQIILTPGSRSQLLEQLQVLDSIPNDEEVESRLTHIQEQIASLETKEVPALDSNLPLQEFMFGEKGKETVKAETKSATYSKAPTSYNVDPYREISGE